MESEILEAELSHAIFQAALFSVPPLLAMACAGLLCAAAQAVTQIQDQALSYLVKLLVLCGIGFMFGPWACGEFLEYNAGINASIKAISRTR